MYQWKQAISDNAWLAITDVAGHRQAFRCDRVLRIYEGYPAREPAFTIEDRKKRTYILLADGAELETDDDSVDDLVRLICGDRSSKED